MFVNTIFIMCDFLDIVGLIVCYHTKLGHFGDISMGVLLKVFEIFGDFVRNYQIAIDNQRVITG
jgi:hypothetical protein